jgi:hypothetical protein
MIKNFNFYDIYGYLIPGLVVLGVFWLPFGLTTGAWPAQEWSSALIVVVLAYVVGHVLQTFTHTALPDRFDGRFPSDKLLDAEDKRFTDEFKEVLCRKISRVFGLEAEYEPDETSKKGKGAMMRDGERGRGIAFFLCRSAIMQCRAGGYAEQAQGMYVLTRGLSAALALGAALHFGWFAGSVCATHWPGRPQVSLLVGAGTLAIGVAGFFCWRERSAPEEKKKRSQPGSAVALMTAVLLLGVVLGRHHPALQEGGIRPDAAENRGACCLKIIDLCCGQKASPVESTHADNILMLSPVPFQGWLFGLVLAEILFTVKLYDTFKRFAELFAQSVYRDFFALGACGKSGTSAAAEGGKENEE